MSQFFSLLKTEFRNTQRNKFLSQSKLALVFRYIFSAIFLLGIVGVLLLVFNRIISIAVEFSIEKEFIIFFSLAVMIIEFIFSIGQILKTLYTNNDCSQLLLFPVKPSLIFFAKVTYLYFKQLISVFVVVLPVLILFNITTGAGALSYFAILPYAILLPLFPFSLALILSIPILYVMMILKNQYLMLLILNSAIIATGFFAYIKVLQFILKIINNNSLGYFFTFENVNKIKGFSSYLIISQLFKNLILCYKPFYSLVIIIGLLFVIAVVLYYFANKIYFNVLRNSFIIDANFESKKTAIVKRTQKQNLFNKEFIKIFRSANYSFQYLTIAIVTPLLVCFSNIIVSSVSVSKFGTGLLPGITVLLLIMFLTLSSSFAATSITREGKNFANTKTIPVSYKTQIKVKLSLYLIVSIPSILLSVGVLFFCNFISIIDAIIIFIAVNLIVIANICAGINADLKNPQFKYLQNDEFNQNNKNVNQTIVLGFSSGVVLGFAAIVMTYLLNINFAYLTLLAFSVPYFIILALNLFIKIEKKYKRIEA